ncbi:hypothetical protein AB0K16_57210 [Nonomuraea jabiensis]|uniref:hypothetical protein n=1 Tax=Nonomuraea jabiensis TaxID=882448 RepID=UPI003423E471
MTVPVAETSVPLVGDRLQQRAAGGEVAAHGGRAHSRHAGDLLQGRDDGGPGRRPSLRASPSSSSMITRPAELTELLLKLG